MDKIIIEYNRQGIETLYGKLSDEQWVELKTTIENDGESILENEIAFAIDSFDWDEKSWQNALRGAAHIHFQMSSI